MGVQTFLAKLAIKGFDEGIISRLPRFSKVSRSATVYSPENIYF